MNKLCPLQLRRFLLKSRIRTSAAAIRDEQCRKSNRKADQARRLGNDAAFAGAVRLILVLRLTLVLRLVLELALRLLVGLRDIEVDIVDVRGRCRTRSGGLAGRGRRGCDILNGSATPPTRGEASYAAATAR